ncbi:methyltransferase domain-containing protein [Paractinoplanes durhamensis]|uniref:Class I SAM-dependent methyltransferase n=1 Tax=Paractinoplanes durhamensis TaxID=113563 RepID=A0ABQ3Z1L1_9ACTN|nr:hypothetical protein [Actinoplanes durhamensis]GIE03709.1 hypothetical protein Adu01nite_50590 [Actinoplanes durhamensis]
MIRLIGGEMPGWTEDRPPAGGALLRYVIDQLPDGADVLMAGPHDEALVDALATRASVTCLVRSQPDALALDATGVAVLCGTLTKLESERWDFVVALDGVGRLCSVEDAQLDWAESLAVLKRALRPGGTLLLAVENELGVHRLVDPATGTALQDNSAWRPLGEFDESRPGTPARLTARLAAEGLAVDWLGAAWPTPAAPTLIATSTALDSSSALAALAAGALATAYAEKSVLSDPRRLASTAVRAGLGAELAAGWLVVAHLAPRAAPALQLPPVLLGDGPLGERALPAGRLLEELLLGAALRGDLPTLRRLLTGWMAALPETTAESVIVDHDTFVALDPSAPPRADALRRFANTLLTGGYAHPWPAFTDLATLTEILHGVAGLPGDYPAVMDGEDPLVPDSRREHAEQLQALRRELADAASRAEFYEKLLGKREKELQKARRQIATFSDKAGYRFVKLGYGVARKARNRLRKGTK